MQSPVVLALLVLCVGLSCASAHGPEIRSRRMVGRLAESVPWQVLLKYGDTVLDGGLDGGALISNRWILTSGRSVFLNKTRQATKRVPTTLPKVYVGVTDTMLMGPSNEVEIETVVVHPDFQKSTNWDNNLAMIKLKEPVTFSEKVMPIPLPVAGQDLEEKEGTLGVVAGWGWGSQMIFAKQLKYLAVPIVRQGLCKDEYSKGGHVLSDFPEVNNHTFCTGATKYLENVCFGDEGGALAVLDPKDGSVYAAGILSFDKNCQVEKYAVHTKLSSYMPWIHSVMREDCHYKDLRTTIMRKMLPAGQPVA